MKSKTKTGDCHHSVYNNDINLTVSIEDYVNLLVTLYHEKHNLWRKSLVGSEVIKSAYHLHGKFAKIFRKKIRSCFSLS